MKTAKAYRYLLILAGLYFFQGNVMLYSQEEMIIELPNKGRPCEFNFSNPQGSVRVEGYDGEWFIISARVRGSQQGNISVPEGMSLVPKEEFGLRADTEGNRATLFCESSRVIDFNIKVPRRCSLDIGAVDNGEIEIYRIDGEIEADNRSGGVKLVNISGSTVVTTVYGDISADYRTIEEDATVMLTSYEGKIELKLKRDSHADLMIKSQEGNIFSDIEIKTAGRDTEVSESGQGKEYSLRSWTKATLNGGGSSIFLSSYFGDIYIKESKKESAHVK